MSELPNTYMIDISGFYGQKTMDVIPVQFSSKYQGSMCKDKTNLENMTYMKINSSFKKALFLKFTLLLFIYMSAYMYTYMC